MFSFIHRSEYAHFSLFNNPPVPPSPPTDLRCPDQSKILVVRKGILWKPVITSAQSQYCTVAWNYVVSYCVVLRVAATARFKVRYWWWEKASYENHSVHTCLVSAVLPAGLVLCHVVLGAAQWTPPPAKNVFVPNWSLSKTSSQASKLR